MEWSVGIPCPQPLNKRRLEVWYYAYEGDFMSGSDENNPYPKIQRYEWRIIYFALACLTTLGLAVIAGSYGCSASRIKKPDGTTQFEWRCR